MLGLMKSSCFWEFVCSSIDGIRMTGCTLSVTALRRERRRFSHTDCPSGVENAVSGVGSYQCLQIVE